MSEFTIEQKMMALEGNYSWVDFAKYGIRRSINEENGHLVCKTEIYHRPPGEAPNRAIKIEPPNYFE